MQTDDWHPFTNQKVFMMILVFRKFFCFSIGLLVCFSTSLKAQPLEIGEFQALLIANQHYQYWDDLKTPHNDVEKIAEILRNNYSFSTKVIKDASSADIIDAIDEYQSKLTSKDNFLIY